MIVRVQLDKDRYPQTQKLESAMTEGGSLPAGTLGMQRRSEGSSLGYRWHSTITTILTGIIYALLIHCTASTATTATAGRGVGVEGSAVDGCGINVHEPRSGRSYTKVLRGFSGWGWTPLREPKSESITRESGRWRENLGLGGEFKCQQVQ